MLVDSKGGNMSKNASSKYMQIKIDIESKITSGHFRPNDRVPSENEIASDYNVSIITSRKALDSLVHDGLIYRRKGKGSFVCEKPNLPVSHDSYSNIVTFILLSYNFSDSSTMQFIKGAYTVLTEMGKSMIVEYSKDEPEREADILDKCIKDKSAGVLLFSTDPEQNLNKLNELKSNNIPFILVDRGIKQFPVNIVSCYNLDGTYKMANYLIENGHRKIMFISNNRHILTEQLRFEGMMLALDENKIPFIPELFVTDFAKNPLDFLEGFDTYHPTAIMCVNDLTACKVSEILMENNISVPDDVSITGFDDAEIAKYNNPKLTTVKQDFFQIGKKAAELLIDIITGKSGCCSQVYLPVELVIRDSVRKIN